MTSKAFWLSDADVLRVTVERSGVTDWGKWRYTATVALNGAVVYRWTGLEVPHMPYVQDTEAAAIAAALSFASLAVGDTDPEFFDDYTPAQLDFADRWGDDPSLLAEAEDERARRLALKH